MMITLATAPEEKANVEEEQNSKVIQTATSNSKIETEPTKIKSFLKTCLDDIESKQNREPTCDGLEILTTKMAF